MSLRLTLAALTAVAASALLAGCHDDGLAIGGSSGGPTGDTIALTSSGKVLTFNRGNLANLVSSTSITGLAAGESFLGLDVRPADKLIYGVTNRANLYTLNDATGVATLRFALKAGAATAATCTGGAPAAYTALSGTEFGLDFNPMADRLRLASNTGQNLRINVADGATIVDCPITFMGGAGTPAPTGAAYTNSVSAAASTALMYVDSGTDMLYAIDNSTTDSGTMAPTNANNGILRPVGALGVDIGATNGFDIEALTNTGYGVFTVGSTSSLYTIDLTTGAATVRVRFAEPLRGITLK